MIMACFLVPTAEAIGMTIVTKVVKSKEKEPVALKSNARNEAIDSEKDIKIPFSR